MSTKTVRKAAAIPASRSTASRQSVTFELVVAHAPTVAQAEKMSAAFGLDEVDYHGIREATEEQVGRAARALQPTVSETAMRIHLQRVVGAFVGSAYGAAQFYGSKVTQARDLSSKLANDHRDEDRDGVYGFDTRAARARRFAAEAGLTACALMAAAEGAVNAYAEITGEDWKPYTPTSANAATVTRQAADSELAAFG